MARYVSRFGEPVILLRNEEARFIAIQGSDKMMRHVEKRELVARFRPGLFSSYDKNFAVAAFSGKLVYNSDGTVSFGSYQLDPYSGRQMGLAGAMPNTTPYNEAIPNTDLILQIEGYDITQKMSTFDTQDNEDGWDAEEQIEGERLLDAGAGNDYIKIAKTKVAAPWPSFDEMCKGAGAPLRIRKQVEDMGYDPAMIVAYLEQMDPTPTGVLNEMLRYVADLQQEQAEDASLVTRVD